MKLSQKILAVVLGSAVAVAFVVGVSSTSASAASYVFTRTLTVGSTGTDVMNLQKVLNSSSDTQVAVTGAGSPGMESSYFGGLTKAAVIKFQNKYASQILTPVGLTSGTGLVGASTRALLNNWTSTGTTVSNCAAGQVYNPATGALCTTTGTVTSGPLSVSLANTVSYGALVSPSATAKLASFTFTGTGTVSNVWLQRIGVSSDQTLTNVYLYDGATRLTDAASVSSGNISFNNPSGLFTVNGSRTITVRADIASAQGGATVGVGLASYTVVGGTAVTANISGATQNIASNINAATVTVGTQTVAAQSVNAGASNITIWSAPVNVGTRSVFLQAVSFKYIGSAPANSLSNTSLLIDGAAVSSNATINQNGYLTFDLSSAPLTLSTGSHTLSVQANIVGGAYRNFQLSLQNAGDLMVADSQLQGVNVAPTTVSQTVFITNNGGLITINQGTLTVQLDPAFNPTTVTGGATNVPIAQFKLTSYGEDVKVNSLVVEPLIGGSPTSLNNVGLYVNGAQVGSTLNDATSTGLTFGTNNLFVIPAGQSVILTVKADTISAQNTNYTTGNLSVALPTGSSNAQGVQSSQLVNVPTATVTSNIISIGSGSATVASNTSLSNQTVSPNSNTVKIGSYIIQASSAEGLRVNNIVVNLGGTITPSTGLTGLYIVTPAGTTNPIAPQTTNSFSTNGFTIPTSGTGIVDVYANISGNTGTASSSISITAQGLTSNVTVTGTATGQTVTVGNGTIYGSSITFATSTSAVAQYVVSPQPNGNSSFPIAVYKIVSTTSPATIQELHFDVTGANTIASIKVTGHDASGNPVSVSAPVSGGTATITSSNLTVNTGFGGDYLTVTPTFNGVGNNGLSSPSTSVVTLSYVKALIGSNTVTPVVSRASNQMSLVATKPTVAIQSPSSNLVTGAQKLARITVTADAAGPLNIDQIPLSVTSNSGAAAITSQILVIKDVNGNNITGATSTALAVSAGGNGTANITFGASGYQIQAGQTATFDVYATESGSLGASGTSSIVTALGSAGSFTWTDVAGNSSEGGLSGTLLTNYPTNTASLSN